VKAEEKGGIGVNFGNISYFLAIVEEGSISAASRKLYISQQALSEQLKKMEDEVGAPLLKRGKKIELTVAGECLYRDGRELLHIYEGMMDDIQDVTNKRRRKVTLGIPTLGTPHYLPELLERFYEKYPECEIAVVKRQHTDIAHNMNGVDLYLSPLPLNPGLANSTVLESDPFHVLFREDLAWRVYGERWPSVAAQLDQTQNLALCKEMPFIALRDRYGHLIQSLELIFNEYHLSPAFGFSSENLDLNEHACLHSLGCMLATQSHVRFLLQKGGNGSSNLVSYPVRVTSFETKLAISHPKGLLLHTAEIRLIDEARELLKQPN
jgi:molybdate transport repressor ModE-like protein